ncbi:DUF5642 family protein [Mycobacteroides abscessus]|uniref:DUF5642 family protein n=1 Tax=Mycobacteroides abscessus TaxID=36809 RepID=UPI000C256D6D|nr:DUF5642 family protein [Mycobacteroides abscessus]
MASRFSKVLSAMLIATALGVSGCDGADNGTPQIKGIDRLQDVVGAFPSGWQTEITPQRAEVTKKTVSAQSQFAGARFQPDYCADSVRALPESSIGYTFRQLTGVKASQIVTITAIEIPGSLPEHQSDNRDCSHSTFRRNVVMNGTVVPADAPAVDGVSVTASCITLTVHEKVRQSGAIYMYSGWLDGRHQVVVNILSDPASVPYVQPDARFGQELFIKAAEAIKSGI